jgi:hypothetical protein
VPRVVELNKPGRRGPRGPRGARGWKGRPGSAADPRITDALREDIESMRAEAAIQMRRIAQLQAQLDVARKEIHALSGRQGWTDEDRRERTKDRR